MNKNEEQMLIARIRFARQLHGSTQQQCADALGIPRTSYTQIEAGNRSLKVVELQALARFFQLDMLDLVTPQSIEIALCGKEKENVG